MQEFINQETFFDSVCLKMFANLFVNLIKTPISFHHVNTILPGVHTKRDKRLQLFEFELV